MKKTKILDCLYKDSCGYYIAKYTGINDGITEKTRFLYYSKKEIIQKLRNEYGVKVSKTAIY